MSLVKFAELYAEFCLLLIASTVQGCDTTMLL
jgi:hypothetical protein